MLTVITNPLVGFTDARVGDQVGRGSVHRDPPRLHHIAPVGDLQRAIGVLFHQKHGHVQRLQPLHHVEDLGNDDRRKAHRGFIEQKAGRPPHQRAGHRQHLLLAAGQAPGRKVALFLEDREHLEGVFHVLIHPVVGVEIGAEAEVFLDREVGEDLSTLGRLRQPASDAAPGGDARKIVAPEGDRPARSRVDTRQAAQKRGLARAVRADHGDDLARVHRKVDAVQHFDPPVAGAQTFNQQHVRPPDRQR
jgi:hypothetical protein